MDEVSPVKALIAYCTRYGATASTSEEIAKGLREEGFDVRVVNVKKEKMKDISQYDLIIVGSGMKISKWCGEAESFIKKFHNELRQKKIAIFISSGAQAIHKHEGNIEAMDDAWKKNLIEKAEKYSLEPILLGLFGGVWDYNKMGFFFRKTMGPFKELIEAAGFQEQEPGVYDTRDWDEIRKWTKNLAQKVKENET